MAGIWKWCLLLAGVTLTALFGCSVRQAEQTTEAAEDKIILRYGDVNPEGNLTVKTAHYFANQVRELSGGRIEIDVYSSGQLGDELQCYEQVQMGALDFYRANSGTLNRAGEMEVSVLALPYLFQDRDHLWRVCGSELGRRLLADIQESGSQMIGVCYVDEGKRNLFMKEKPVTRLSDLKGKTIRIMVSDVLEDTIRALGAIPVQSTYAELYNTLESGEVDGAENPVISYYSNKFYRTAPYYTKTGHMYSPSVMVMSEITWDHLTKEDQQIIRQAAEQTEEYNREECDKAEREAYRRLMAANVGVTEVIDPENWVEAVAGVYEKYGVGYEDLIAEIRAMGGQEHEEADSFPEDEIQNGE